MRNATLSKPGNRVWTQTPRVARAPAAAALARTQSLRSTEATRSNRRELVSKELSRKERIGT